MYACVYIYIYMYIYIYIYIHMYMYIQPESPPSGSWPLERCCRYWSPGVPAELPMPNLPTNIVGFRGFDSSIILI